MEYFLGEGPVELDKILPMLKKKGIEGVIQPEHVGTPQAPGEDVTKRAVEYLKGIVNSPQLDRYFRLEGNFYPWRAGD